MPQFKLLNLAHVRCTVFHCTLALSSANEDVEQRRDTPSPLTAHHLSRTFELINRRLSSRAAVSDATLAVVVSLIIHAAILHDPALRRLHMDGLCRIIELRGGFDTLLGNPHLLLKICRSDSLTQTQLKEMDL